MFTLCNDLRTLATTLGQAHLTVATYLSKATVDNPFLPLSFPTVLWCGLVDAERVQKPSFRDEETAGPACAGGRYPSARIGSIWKAPMPRLGANGGCGETEVFTDIWEKCLEEALFHRSSGAFGQGA